MATFMMRSVAPALTLFMGLVLMSAGSEAVENCKVKVSRTDGTLQVSATNVATNPRWGAAAGQETNMFSNEGTCVVAGTASKCELAAPGNPQRITPPDLCTLSLADDGPTDCSAYIRGCTPGVRTVGAGAIVAGTIVAFAGATAPSGWLLCNGAAVSRTTYTALFAAIGISHGQGDGITTFNLPDYQGRFLRGVDNGAGRDPDAASRSAMNAGGNTGGAVGSVQGHELASHHHSFITDEDSCVSCSGSVADPIDRAGFPTGSVGGRDTSNVGGNETRPVNAYVNWIIKY
jgi:microcystin-dependent protein